MSTSIAFQELADGDVTQALNEVLVPHLKKWITERTPGHCMRVANLDLALMVVLCRELRKECPFAQIYILKGNGMATRQKPDEDLFVSSTKLVELRNPLPEGTLRQPLLVFLPANLHASAEDSFGIATFEDIPVAGVYKELLQQLILRVPAPLQGYIHDLFAILTSAWWPWADEVTQVRFLLTAIKNRVDGESLGASLYELGMIPDFRLFEDPALMQSRIRRNLESMRKITYSDASPRGRVLELGLSDRDVQRRLTGFLADVGVVDPYAWTRQIVINKNNWDISFDKWKFIEEINKDKVSIQILSITIPEVDENNTDERLDWLNGQKVLNPNQQSRFSVIFCVDPHPSRIPSLDYFTVQILTKNGEPVGGARRINARNWSSKKSEHTVHLDRLNKLDFEDGWYIVRVLPWTKEEEPVPLEEPLRNPGEERVRLNDSEPFYVLREGELVDPPQRAIPHEHSLEHARLRIQFRKCAEQRDPQEVQVAQIEWLNRSSKTRQHQEILEVKLVRGGKFHIYASSYLKALEQQILASPYDPVNWLWQINEGVNSNTAPVADIREWPKSIAVESFLDIRAKYFAALRSGPLGEGTITQVADLCTLRDVSLEYAEAYRDLLADLAQKVTQSRDSDQQRAILALKTALAIDTVHMVLTDIRGHVKEAVMLGPTHPLRALWFTTWARVAQQWLAAAQNGPEEYIIPVRDGVLALVPFNVPATLSCTDGRIFMTVDNITPFWSLYAPPTEEDTRGLLGEICTVLCLPEPAISGETITAETLTTRIGRYLVQHPYIRTLSINAFNPGLATTLAQALLQLQKQEVFSQLRYDIRLFVPDPTTPGVGESIETLLTPNMATSTEITDAFSTPGSNHLFPKLSLAVHPFTAFYETPQRYRAHLSVLFDLFPAQEIGAGSPFHVEHCSPLYGLVQDFVTLFQDGEEGTFWRRQPRHGKAQPLLDGDESVDLLAVLEQMLSGMVATVATGIAAFEQRPVVMFSLTTMHRELIHYVHDVSDWVVTVDRNVGIEFFDHGKKSDRPDYLIDYTPGINSSSGHQLMITSRAMLELEATLKPFLAQYGLPASQREAALILEQLRALSGRLAFKLISSPTYQMEVLGLALARLFLLHQGALYNQVILPFDMHLELFRAIKRAGEELGEAITLQRTDLALFDLNAATRTLRCNLVEVKCYSQLTVGVYAQLKDSIAEQIGKSEEVLRRHFDPQYKQPDRPDRLLKTQELVTLLEFYLGHSLRYGVIHPEAGEEARFLLATLEKGYTLEFTRSALIFDLEEIGLGPPDIEYGIEFYRIGRDQIEALLEETELYAPTKEGRRERSNSSVQRLPSATFIAPERDDSVTWDGHKNGMAEQEVNRGFTNEEVQENQFPDTLNKDEPISRNMPIEDDEEFASSQEEGEDLAAIKPQEQSIPLEVEQAVLVAEPAQSWLIPYDVMLGIQGPTPQYGLLGEISGRKVALDLNQTHTISLFGVQGSGKSYTLGSIVEMACLAIPNVNVLPSPLATVIFHYSPTQDYKPEFTSMVYANTDQNQIAQLWTRYGAEPNAMRDVVLLVPAAKLTERQREYPDLEVQPLTFAASELKVVHWKFLMGCPGYLDHPFRKQVEKRKKFNYKTALYF